MEAHAGTEVSSGVSAIRGAIRFLPGVLGLSDLDQGVLVTPTMINGGRRRSVVPGKVAVVLDLRASDTNRWNQMARALEELVRAYDGPENVSLRFAAHRPGVSRTPDVDRLIDLVQGVGSAISMYRVPSRRWLLEVRVCGRGWLRGPGWDGPARRESHDAGRIHLG